MSRTSFRVNLHSVVCLNVKEFLAWRRHHIWSLSYNSGIRTHNHLVYKWTLNHLAKLASLVKWFSVRLRIKWLWARIPLLSLKWGKLFACFESTNNFWYQTICRPGFSYSFWLIILINFRGAKKPNSNHCTKWEVFLRKFSPSILTTTYK